MYTLLVILIVMVALMLIGIVLVQESKGGGLSSLFADYKRTFGISETTDFVEKFAWYLAGIMAIISIACAYTAP